ncbi:hypothetical protein [Azospirillum sp. TSO22-1]|uniref:hypothetical protein n=1 Tax=Azospirillum sp. TSO22-1 TaxID=716789 RepID=UPI000D61862D|nr:hypothetical protein [Azospirillum sp. TSO22-1]PWC41355.1 hypothetical protein TSO221_23850 [Azospirillum sp. TSO22-1]
MAGRRWRRVWWWGCGLLLAAGLAGMVGIVIAPPEHFDEDGNLIGEMPPEFALAFCMAVLGLAGLVAGGVVRLLLWTRGGRMR